ncbi:TPA: AAA family ATPase [Pseudomonas aeruginosa]|jgi:predicted ATP-dependent endonuclease of OLD family|uniref:AAA family ATPase n=1 Tax=Pseudomonas aeruginosa TaxID=287 RepID=UPI0009A4FEC3|nr:AAA family ATPase [Pseudomonas aeruginosa]EKU8672191.1 AAA family ATPase [Pseudomonas aeruginosa]EKX1327977.1 AAA family ATPase [Pseudomonas aeruginosa]EKX7785670.1 AAA family ATPase [Pseudomonas aeruginosa]MBG6353088.1 AAA family ATPase [Pseudomonas aeruginosa]MDY1246664.1 AAA family ATPase [Pseudomonas aeruginosa]
MKLQTLRLSNFQSYGPGPTDVDLVAITYLIGPNGSGKTAALQALCRLFAFDPAQRRIQRSDFHVPFAEKEIPAERQLWIEADFLFPELAEDEDNSTVAPHFGHMRLDEPDGIPRVRFRLSAAMGPDGDIEETFVYVLDVNPDGSPLTTAQVPRAERNHIHVHYLPARRDPADHIAYGANALLGRILRAVQWDKERDVIRGLTDGISDSLAANPSVNAFSVHLQKAWTSLHKGNFFADPKITFVASEIEALLRHMSVSFTPGHDENLVDFSRLSDGQKSMLYLSLVLSSQAIGRAVLAEQDKSFDPDKLRPPVFTLVAVEEPENSLSPHYLGRIVSTLNAMTSQGDAQALIATHAPSMLRRVEPEHIRYLRLTEARQSRVTCIQLPEKADDAHKFVREAVQAFPEVYFSRLVVLGEGDSEEIVLPRLLRAKGAPVDESAVIIAPLGGRHVNHFWRLLSALQIPYLTLLDLDVARHQAGWGRVKNVNDQLAKFEPTKTLPADWDLPKWNVTETPIRTHHCFGDEKRSVFAELEQRGVFFSAPLDLDFAMLLAYPDAYSVEVEVPGDDVIKAVLGKSHHNPSQYSEEELKLFGTYQQRFKLGSKPAAHISALAQLSDQELLKDMPASLGRLADAVIAKLAELPE